MELTIRCLQLQLWSIFSVHHLLLSTTRTLVFTYSPRLPSYSFSTVQPENRLQIRIGSCPDRFSSTLQWTPFVFRIKSKVFSVAPEPPTHPSFSSRHLTVATGEACSYPRAFKPVVSTETCALYTPTPFVAQLTLPYSSRLSWNVTSSKRSFLPLEQIGPLVIHFHNSQASF